MFIWLICYGPSSGKAKAGIELKTIEDILFTGLLPWLAQLSHLYNPEPPAQTLTAMG